MRSEFLAADAAAVGDVEGLEDALCVVGEDEDDRDVDLEPRAREVERGLRRVGARSSSQKGETRSEKRHKKHARACSRTFSLLVHKPGGAVWAYTKPSPRDLSAPGT